MIAYIRNLSGRQLEQFEAMMPEEGDWADQLNPEQIQGIKKAQEQVRNGQTVSSQEVWDRFRQQFPKP